MQQRVAPPRPLGQRIDVDIDNVSVICQREPLLKYLLLRADSGTTTRRPMPSKGQCNAARSTVDVEHHPAHYFYYQVLIVQPTDFSSAVETDSD
jgi:hypothetical protein